MHPLAVLDHKHVWHPFTQMRDWLRHEPVVVVRGQGARLWDARGRSYLDGNASIWTNLHGHAHPKLDRALRGQLKRIAHSSALGLANEPASRLAARLVGAVADPPARLRRVFFSDDGSTAVEVALKLAYEYTRRTRGDRRPRFLGVEGAYHGDTVGAVSLGHIDLFHQAYAGLLFRTDRVMAPYCYRCPFNRARPERGDAREYRRCQWECVDQVERRLAVRRRRGPPYAAFVYEPLMQGAAGMIPQPAGWLPRVAALVRAHGGLLVADEVMTGFGRAGLGGDLGEGSGIPNRPRSKGRAIWRGPALFASQVAGVQPDLLCLAKGLTGGYLPMGATLVTDAVFEAFLGEYSEFKTFFHGHSYTGNQLAAAVGLASLDLLEQPSEIRRRAALEQQLEAELGPLRALSHVGDIRRVGLMVGVELVRDWRTRSPFDLAEQAGIRVCAAMTRRGVLTRPVGNVVVLMPPYVTTPDELSEMVTALRRSVVQVLGR